ncbi:MAG: hypothetical protein WKF34_11385 [Pyrinomonadaceae bacterium]
MSVVVKFFELLLLAIGCLFNPFILILVTFPLIANLATAFVYSRSRGKDVLSPHTFLPIGWSMLILAVGAIFAYHGKPAAAPPWSENVVYVLLFLQLAHCVWLTFKNANRRWITIAVCLLFLLFGLTCTMMSLTSMTNQWE